MNVELVAISMDNVEAAAQMAEFVGAEFPILSDPDGEVARRYKVFDLLGDGVAAPATFIIGKEGTVLWGHVGQDITDRPPAEAILGRLQELLE